MLLKENAKRIEKVYYNATKWYDVYVFNCSQCSKEIRPQKSALKRHSGKCVSCSQQGKPYAHIYNELKNHRNRKVEFSISYEEFLNVISKAECEYCGKLLEYNKHSKNWGKNLTRAHQLDRKDNTKGYTVDNITCCCWTCNRLKSDVFTYEEFMKLSPILKEIRLERESNNAKVK